MFSGTSRIQNVEIGYNFPNCITQKIRASNLRIFTNGFNLLSYDALKSSTSAEPGCRVTTYPKRVYIGLNFKIDSNENILYTIIFLTL